MKFLGIVITILMGIGVGQAITVSNTQEKVIANQTMILAQQATIIKIEDKQVEILNALAANLALAMDRQVTLDKLNRSLRK